MNILKDWGSPPAAPTAGPAVASYADAAKKAMPSVVNIYTSKEMRQRHPLMDDSILRRYFPEVVNERFGDGVRSHRLRREIVAVKGLVH